MEGPIKIYKRERTTVEKILGQYENGKTKMVSLKQWTKKCGLLVGKMSGSGDTYVYDSGIEMSFEEMEKFADALPRMSKSLAGVNYAELGESKDSYGNEYRVVLKRSEFDGLKVCKFKKTSTPIDFTIHDDDTDDAAACDPEPATSTATEKPAAECWKECFDKFYINKNDDWKKIGNIIRDFCCEANSVLNGSALEGIDVIPATPPPEQHEIGESQSGNPVRKRKPATKGGVVESKKKKPKVAPTVDLEGEVRYPGVIKWGKMGFL
jgi:hypothetical protein